MRGRTSRIAVGTLLATLAGASAACSADTTSTTATTAEAGGGGGEDTTTTTTTAGEDAVEVVEITARDYAYDGVPDSVVAGTQLSLTAGADGEPHELVAFLLEGEDRSADELLARPEDLEGILSGPPATVILALPGRTDVPGPVVGDGTLTEPGRYLLVCTFPVGTTPEALERDGPLEDGGPPHFTAGMYAELNVE